MAKSQKLLVAVALLIVGYGLALAWNASANFFWPNATWSSAPDNNAALIPGSSLVAAPMATNSAQLVPATSANQPSPPSSTGTATSPLWLSAGTQTNIASSATVPNQQIGQSNGGGNHENVASTGAPAASSGERDAPTVTPLPTAQITAVKPVEVSTTADASPWDRWPRWEPAAAVPAPSVESTGTPTNQVTTASMQQPATTASPAAIQASFSSLALNSSADRLANRLVPVPQPFADDDQQDEPRTHTIVDGDSLAKLAERFLGDPKLGGQIYDLNRDVLTNPELLPIGAELKLPARQVATTQRPLPMPSVPPAATSNPPGMVPVEDIRKAFVGMPRAQLLRPLPPIEESNSAATSVSFATSGN